MSSGDSVDEYQENEYYGVLLKESMINSEILAPLKEDNKGSSDRSRAYFGSLENDPRWEIKVSNVPQKRHIILMASSLI